jgi:hypothetical protein
MTIRKWKSISPTRIDGGTNSVQWRRFNRRTCLLISITNTPLFYINYRNSKRVAKENRQSRLKIDGLDARILTNSQLKTKNREMNNSFKITFATPIMFLETILTLII